MRKHLYNEVYVVGVDNTASTYGDLTVCDSFEDLINHLKTKNTNIHFDLRVLHGVLTSAESIPKELMGRQAFLLFKTPEDQGGIMIDSDVDDDHRELANEIEECLRNEELASFFFGIEDVYILYGYELTLTLSVDEDDLDEELIADCLQVGKAARQLKEDDKNG